MLWSNTCASATGISVMRKALGVLLSLLLLAQCSLPVAAHKMAPLLVDVSFQPMGIVELHWRKPLDNRTVSLLLPPHCVPLGQPRVEIQNTALDESMQLRCPGEDFVVGLVGLAEARSVALLRWRSLDEVEQQQVLTVERPSLDLRARPANGADSSFLDFGLKHIASGLDHLLFVLGLFLITRGWRQRLVSVTAFTLGHSVSLLLSALGMVLLWLPLVELGIALSVLALALCIPRGVEQVGNSARLFPIVVTAVGFLHGLGFASALNGIGLVEGNLLSAVFLFNVGVELGQLGFIALLVGLFSLIAAVDRRWPGVGLEDKMRVLAIYSMGGLAVFWTAGRAWEAATVLQLL